MLFTLPGATLGSFLLLAPVLPPAPQLGETTFQNSGSSAAQPAFLKGLLLLHSFEYESAADSFRAAQSADPTFALAYWGEAMTFNHAIWGEQDKDAARKALERLGPTPEARLQKAPTEREKDYLRSVDALFGTGSKAERDAAYSEAMARMAARYPADLDARSFYALSLLGLTGAERNVANYMRAAAVAEEVYEINPRHPGALHYLIHAYDDPLHAPLGLRAATRYGSVAPAASHAQHMPSHIFFALGMWEESVKANLASMQTARDHGAGGYHYVHWLEYAYLQLGRRNEAEQLVAMVEGDVRKDPTPRARISLANLRATWLVETRGAGAASFREPVDRTGIAGLNGFADHAFARGLTAVEGGDRGAADAALADLKDMVQRGRAVVGADDSAHRHDHVTASDIRWAGSMARELAAVLAFADGKPEEALAEAHAAAQMEDESAFEFGPPGKPPHELLGELLLKMGRQAEARAEFGKALERTPNRALTVAGLARASVAP